MQENIKVDNIVRKTFVVVDGSEIEVKVITNPDDYDTTVYQSEYTKGAKVGQALYAVRVEDYKPRERATVAGVKNKIEALKASGMSAEDILAALL